MKQFNTILLFSFIIGLTVPKDVFHFLVHLPAYMDHFHHHNNEHEPIGLLDFISKHTGISKHEDNDHPEHDNLPFNQQHSCDCNQSLTFIPFYSKQTIKFHLPVTTDKKIIVKQFFPGSEYTRNIWQPPKIS